MVWYSFNLESRFHRRFVPIHGTPSLCTLLMIDGCQALCAHLLWSKALISCKLITCVYIIYIYIQMIQLWSSISCSICTGLLPLKTHGFVPTKHPSQGRKLRSQKSAEELQRDALPTHWWPCQTHRRLFFPTQGEGDNHVGRFHGGVAGEQPNRIQQPNGRDGNQIGVNG